MKNNRRVLSLYTICQTVILLGSVMNPPAGWVMFTLNVWIPVLSIIYFCLVSGGFIRNMKE